MFCVRALLLQALQLLRQLAYFLTKLLQQQQLLLQTLPHFFSKGTAGWTVIRTSYLTPGLLY